MLPFLPSPIFTGLWRAHILRNSRSRSRRDSSPGPGRGWFCLGSPDIHGERESPAKGCSRPDRIPRLSPRRRRFLAGGRLLSMTSRISSTRPKGTLSSTIADSTFSSRMSVRRFPRDRSAMSWVTGLFGSNSAPAFAKAAVMRSISRNHVPTPGRPNSTTKPASPAFTRWVTSLVLTSSVPRPWTPEKARLTTRGQVSSSGSNAAVGQTSGSGSNRSRIQPRTRRAERTKVGFRCSWLIPR